MKTIIRWLIARYLPGYHLAKNPVREKKVYREVKMEDIQDMVVEQLKAKRQEG